MSNLRIEHQTHYSYARPVRFGRHRLVLRPREGHDVRVESMRLEIEPAHDLIWSRDVFGNSVAIVDFLEPADHLQVISHVVVRRTPPFPNQSLRDPWRIAYPIVYDTIEATVAAAYQTASYPDDADAVRIWLDREMPTRGDEAQGVLADLSQLVHRQIQYRRRSEKGVQTPSQTLALGSGSCRDMATLLMDAARALRVAARFASGYLDCPASAAGRASTHAWTEFYLPELGWRGFDPTLGEPTSLKHVVTGVSNHPRGVMPISGMFSGESSDYREMLVSVKIEPIELPA